MKAPMTRMGLHNHYARRFTRTKSEKAAQLALWYLVLHIEFGES